MRARGFAALGAACLGLAASRAIAQDAPTEGPVDRPWEVRYVLEAADSILSTAGAGVSLEAFRDDTVTGVFLKGSHGGREESIGFGRGADRLRYLWFSVDGKPEVEYRLTVTCASFAVPFHDETRTSRLHSPSSASSLSCASLMPRS